MNMMSLNTLKKQVDNKKLNLNAGMANLMSILHTQYPNLLNVSDRLRPLDWVHSYCIYGYDDVVTHLKDEIFNCKPYQSRLLKSLSHTLINVITDSDKSQGCDWFVLKPINNHSYYLITIKNFDELIKETKQMINYYHNLP